MKNIIYQKIAPKESEDIVLTVISPMFNEEDNVLSTLKKIASILEPLGKKYQIVFVNDGSTDNTLEKCKQALKDCPMLEVVSYFPNQGRGKALREGFKYARGRYIFTIDFDLSYDESHIIKMYEELVKNPHIDAILVSSYMPGGKTIGVSFLRLLLSKAGNMILRASFNPKIYTSTCVVRGYKKGVIQNLWLDSDDKDIHLEILSKLIMLGYKVKEIPGILRKRKSGRSKFAFKATSVSHILFTITERPALYLGVLGIFFLAVSFIFSLILVYFRLFPEQVHFHNVLGRFVSSTFVIFLTIVALQSLSFSLIALLLGVLRKEIIKLQAHFKKGEMRE